MSQPCDRIPPHKGARREPRRLRTVLRLAQPQHQAGELTLIQVGPAHGSGGVADVMRAVDEWMRRQDRPCVVVNTSCDGAFVKRLLVGVFGVVRAVTRILVTPRCIVHIHSASYGSFARKALVVAAAHALGRPVVLHIHGAEFAQFVTTGSARRRARVSRALARADVTIVLNDGVRSVLRAIRPGADIRILENPATLVCGETADARVTQVLFLGRLEQRKGIDVLLRAVALLQRDGSDATFVLAGDGQVEEVREAASRLSHPELVHVPGWVGPSGVHRLLHESSVFCLPSRNEGLPMALLQAMGHGLACVVTPVGGMSSVIRDGDTGTIVPVADAEALAAALGALLGDPDLRAALGARAFAAIQRTYTPEVVMRRLEAIYRDILDHRTSSAVA